MEYAVTESFLKQNVIGFQSKYYHTIILSEGDRNEIQFVCHGFAYLLKSKLVKEKSDNNRILEYEYSCEINTAILYLFSPSFFPYFLKI